MGKSVDLPISYIQSGRVDLNHRPHGPEPCALTGLRYAPPQRCQYTSHRVILQIAQRRKHNRLLFASRWVKIRLPFAERTIWTNNYVKLYSATWRMVT